MDTAGHFQSAVRLEPKVLAVRQPQVRDRPWLLGARRQRAEPVRPHAAHRTRAVHGEPGMGGGRVQCGPRGVPVRLLPGTVHIGAVQHIDCPARLYLSTCDCRAFVRYHDAGVDNILAAGHVRRKNTVERRDDCDDCAVLAIFFAEIEYYGNVYAAYR